MRFRLVARMTVALVGFAAFGCDCAMPGIVMKGNPQIGDSYRQEYLPSHAEDQADVVSLTEASINGKTMP